MNVAFFLKPKSEVTHLHSGDSLPEALETLRGSGYRIVPVIDEDGRYVSTVGEGDFLWSLIRLENGALKPLDGGSAGRMCVRDVLGKDKNPPCHIGEPIESLIGRTAGQNFIPIVDDREIFIGIVTRRAVIEYFLKNEAERAGK